MILPHAPLRLKIDAEALVSNWRWLAKMSGGAACGAAVKADGYGIGGRETVMHLGNAGCRDFFVTTWAEAEALLPWVGGASLAVLHGLAEGDMQHALSSSARPVLNTPLQAQRWREQGEGRPCDVMIDTGINRLGLAATDVANGLLDGLEIATLMSHLASADEDVPMNEAQRERFMAVNVPAERRSLANSAGICLGEAYAFDLTRPGLSLYGGVPRREAEGKIRPVIAVEAQIVQRRRIEAGDTVGYNATYTAPHDISVAIINIGYADGYRRAFSSLGLARLQDIELPVIGRVSMDLVTLDASSAPDLREGDWVDLDFDLEQAAAQTGISQYELLTGLGQRFARSWV
jgi:alanine racemase